MPIAKTPFVCLLFSLLTAPVAADERAHQVKELKVTILSTNLTHVGIGEWGFAALVEADGHRILFDTGSRPDTVLLNSRTLDIDLSAVEEVVLSHNHSDHTGGLVRLRQELAKKNKDALRIAHVAPAIFWTRPGAPPDRAMARKKERFEAEGGTFVEHPQANAIHPGIWLTGPVPRRHPEMNYGYHADGKHIIGEVRTPSGLIDDNIPESMSLVINTEKGLVVISGCGHAGLINILEHSTDITATPEVHAAIGGFHLAQASDVTLDWTAKKLVNFEVDNLVGAHCTGLESVYRLRDLANLDRSTAVVGATGASFTLSEGIDPLALAQ